MSRSVSQHQQFPRQEPGCSSGLGHCQVSTSRVSASSAGCAHKECLPVLGKTHKTVSGTGEERGAFPWPKELPILKSGFSHLMKEIICT